MIPIQHYETLQLFKEEITKQAKIKAKNDKLSYMQAREKILKLKYGFDSAYSFDKWSKIQEEKFKEIQSSKLRINCSQTPPLPYHQMRYYYFTSKIKLTINIESGDYQIGPDLYPCPLMSVWVRDSIGPGAEIREPSNDVNAQKAYQFDIEDGEDIYVIKDVKSFNLWRTQWGGRSLIEAWLFTDEHLGTELLRPFHAVDELKKFLTLQR